MKGLVRVASLGLIDHVALRTRAIDTAVEEGMASGLRQLVILGAGLDTRAHRLACLGDSRVFELDHPNTQASKQAHLLGLPVAAAGLQHIPADFQTTTLAQALDGSAFDAASPTFWVWEGVVPYLEESAVQRMLSAIAELSAPGSQLAVTYIPQTAVGGVRRALRMPLRVIGEPLRYLPSPAQMSEALAAAGLLLRTSSCTEDWGKTYAAGTPTTTYEHLALAVKPRGT